MRTRSIQVLSTPRTGSSAFGKLLVESGFSQVSFSSVGNPTASEFNQNGYFEDSGINLCLDNLIRFSFNSRNSFLFNAGMAPNKEEMLSKLKSNFLVKFDLDQSTVIIPDNYVENIKEFTGHDWDVWGLTRMQEGEKWHKAYSRAEVETPEKALNKLQKCFSFLENTDSVFIKDPRLIYLLPLVNTQVRGVVIKRDPAEILRSMRNHYGPNLFTERVLHEDWVSNHFNYKVQVQTFEEYLSIYETFEKYAANNFDIEFIRYEKIHDQLELSRISTSLGCRVAWS